MDYLFVKILGAILLSIITFLIGYTKKNAETKKIYAEINKLKADENKVDLENEIKEIDVSKQLIDFFKKETSELLDRVNILNDRVIKLTTTVNELKKTVEIQGDMLITKDKIISQLKELIMESSNCKMSDNECPIKKKKWF